MFEDLFTWDFISSFIGMVVAVSLLTQLFKNVADKMFGKIKTEKLVYLLSVIVVGVVVATTEQFNIPVNEIIQKVFTALLNSVLVAFTSMKSYENIWSKIPELFGKDKE